MTYAKGTGWSPTTSTTMSSQRMLGSCRRSAPAARSSPTARWRRQCHVDAAAHMGRHNLGGPICHLAGQHPVKLDTLTVGADHTLTFNMGADTGYVLVPKATTYARNDDVQRLEPGQLGRVILRHHLERGRQSRMMVWQAAALADSPRTASVSTASQRARWRRRFPFLRGHPGQPVRRGVRRNRDRPLALVNARQRRCEPRIPLRRTDGAA